VAPVVVTLGLTLITACGSPGAGNNTAQRQDQGPEWRRYLSSGSKACADERYKEAEKSYSRALKCAKKLGKNTAEVAECLREMADLYLTLEKHKKAIKKREEALEIEELWVYGPGSV
jgi:tetratricopeptide (TPR) repeat protein